METFEDETMDLYQAAAFLKLHWQTLRAKAKAGEIPGAKLGRRWVFIKSDLVSHLRSQYSRPRPRSQVQLNEGDSLCCTSELIRSSGGVHSLRQTDSEYKSLLKL